MKIRQFEGVMGRMEPASVVSMQEARERKRADELMRQHGDYLLGLAKRLCRNHFDPEDLVQDVLEKTVRSPDAIPAGANERAWMSRVLHNQFIDRVRRTQTRREQPMEAEPIATPPEQEAWWQTLTSDQVRAQLARLPADQRETFELFIFQQLSYDEIAARLTIAKATVGTRILRARAKLRELLTKEHGNG
jgi:RNA polymerase sigma-70 factor (ECF subfamily)